MEYDSNAFFINPVISIVTRNPSIIRRTSPPLKGNLHCCRKCTEVQNETIMMMMLLMSPTALFSLPSHYGFRRDSREAAPIPLCLSITNQGSSQAYIRDLMIDAKP